VRLPKRALLTVGFLAFVPAGLSAWPADAVTAISRDARKLLPRSLSRLLGDRESEVLDELQRFPPDVSRALAQDLPTGRLRPETLAALEGQAARALELLKEGQVSAGVVRMGGLLRIPADLSDPVLAVGPEGWPPGVTREYYALFAANLSRMPVVLDDPEKLTLGRKDLPALWQSVLDRSRQQAPVIRAELFRDGRVVDRRLDYRSPAWAVSSLAYSRGRRPPRPGSPCGGAQGDTTKPRGPASSSRGSRRARSRTTAVPPHRRHHDEESAPFGVPQGGDRRPRPRPGGARLRGPLDRRHRGRAGEGRGEGDGGVEGDRLF
jgi:hypothetical protein